MTTNSPSLSLQMLIGIDDPQLLGNFIMQLVTPSINAPRLTDAAAYVYQSSNYRDDQGNQLTVSSFADEEGISAVRAVVSNVKEGFRLMKIVFLRSGQLDSVIDNTGIRLLKSASPKLSNHHGKDIVRCAYDFLTENEGDSFVFERTTAKGDIFVVPAFLQVTIDKSNGRDVRKAVSVFAASGRIVNSASEVLSAADLQLQNQPKSNCQI